MVITNNEILKRKGQRKRRDERRRHKRRRDGGNEREERRVWGEGGLGRVKKLSRSSVMCERCANPGFIACLCPPHCPDWVWVRDSGGLHMSLFEESLRKSRTWLRPFSGRLRNPHHRGPLCMSMHSLHMLLANTYRLELTLKVWSH